MYIVKHHSLSNQTRSHSIRLNLRTFSNLTPNHNIRVNSWGDVTFQKKFLQDVGKELNVKELTDWYNVTLTDLSKAGGNNLIQLYNGSLTKLFSSLYPEHDWKPWKFVYCGRGVWDDPTNQVAFMKWAAKELKVNNMEDWYNIKTEDIENLGGRRLVRKYNGSLSLLLLNLFPDYEWLPWRFKQAPKNFFSEPKNQKKFMDWAAKELKIKEMSDWYKVSVRDMYNIGGFNCLQRYKSSLSVLLANVYPEYDWLPWKFSVSSKNYWTNIEEQKRFMDWAAQQLNVKDMSDWYKVSVTDLLKIDGSVLRMYNCSLVQTLSAVYPEYNWLPWKFAAVPKSYWEDSGNQRKFLDWAGKELNIQEMSDWYKVTTEDICKLGGSRLIVVHKSSLSRMLAAVYPEYEWLPWMFTKSPQKIWDQEINKKHFIEWVGEQLKIKSLDDWHSVTSKDLASIGCDPNIPFQQILYSVYPQHNWVFDTKLKASFHRKSQYSLQTVLKTIFPKEEVLEEYRHPDIVIVDRPLELDFYYPRLNLAFEYQGEQHYKNTLFHRFTKSLEVEQQRDLKKNEMCSQKGITLIEVPYWWDRKYESLQATIYSQRPDLFTEKPKGQAIPSSPPATSKATTKNITKKVLMTATEWDYESMDPSGWYMTEKYDGMRLYWNGSDFYTRHGSKVKVPETIKEQMPKVALDGELWTQYGLYQDAINLCRIKDEERWKKALYWVFDAPYSSSQPYEERMMALKEMKEKGQLPSFVNIVQTAKCESKEHLKQYFDNIVAKGGEGVMLREPGSVYKAGRSASLRKYKPFSDTEVKVVENNYPHGFSCVQINGKSLYVGLSDNYEEAKKVKKGAVITVKHQGTNVYGTLQYPKFYRERTDVKWEDLINTP